MLVANQGKHGEYVIKNQKRHTVCQLRLLCCGHPASMHTGETSTGSLDDVSVSIAPLWYRQSTKKYPNCFGWCTTTSKEPWGREKWNEQFPHHGNGTRYIMLEFRFGSCAEPPMAKLNQTSTVEMAATNVLAQRLHSQTGPAELVSASAITDAAFALVFTLPPPTRPAGNRRRYETSRNLKVDHHNRHQPHSVTSVVDLFTLYRGYSV
jgi:hypothetical protein